MTVRFLLVTLVCVTTTFTNNALAQRASGAWIGAIFDSYQQRHIALDQGQSFNVSFYVSNESGKNLNNWGMRVLSIPADFGEVTSTNMADAVSQATLISRIKTGVRIESGERKRVSRTVTVPEADAIFSVVVCPNPPRGWRKIYGIKTGNIQCTYPITLVAGHVTSNIFGKADIALSKFSVGNSKCMGTANHKAKLQIRNIGEEPVTESFPVILSYMDLAQGGFGSSQTLNVRVRSGQPFLPGQNRTLFWDVTFPFFQNEPAKGRQYAFAVNIDPEETLDNEVRANNLQNSTNNPALLVEIRKRCDDQVDLQVGRIYFKNSATFRPNGKILVAIQRNRYLPTQPIFLSVTLDDPDDNNPPNILPPIAIPNAQLQALVSSITVPVRVPGRLLPFPFTITATIDPDNHQEELDEENNTLTSRLTCRR
ncbi:hypothetical protein ACFL17_07960 [Pseudomonadota bacterium]